MHFESRILNSLDESRWDAGLRRFEKSSIFHTQAWARVLSDTYRFTPRYLTVFREKQPVAHLPLMEVSSWLTGRRGVSLPFTDYCEPLAEDMDALQELTDAAIAIGRKSGWKHVEFRSGECFSDDTRASLKYWHHTVRLNKDQEAQFAALKGPVRTAIRKAIGAGVKVETSPSLDAVRSFYRLNAITRRAHGLPPQPMAFFENLHRHIIDRDAGIIVQALVEGQPAAACVYLYRGDRGVYKYGASDKKFQRLRVNDLVMWEGIRWLTARGCTTMSMGKTAIDNEGLRRFKLGWGAEESELRYFKFDIRAGAFVADKDAIAGWHNALFRVMPGAVSRVVGALLYRHMA
jgi:hypothetical protein